MGGGTPTGYADNQILINTNTLYYTYNINQINLQTKHPQQPNQNPKGAQV